MRLPTAVPFDVLALTTATAELGPLQAVLDELPGTLPVALIVTASPVLAGALVPHLRWPLLEVEGGQAPVPGHVYLCPPGRVVEVGEDGRWVLRPAQGEAHPADQLLASLAGSYGSRALAVVLRGDGEDGLDGARVLADAGGTVLAQRPDGHTPLLGRAAAGLIGGGEDVQEDRYAFVLRLSDALRLLDDAVEIQDAVTREALAHFGADRCCFCEVVDGQAIIRRDARRGEQSSVAGTPPLSTLPLLHTAIDAGRPFVVNDVHETDLVDDGVRQLCLTLQVISFVGVPVVRAGQPVGVLCLVQGAARRWTELEVALATEVAERAWAAVERASAQKSLIHSEEKYRTLFNSIDEGVSTVEVIFDENERAVDFRYLENNSAFFRLTGLPSEATGKRWLELAPVLEPLISDRFERIIKTGEPERFEQAISELEDNWYEMYISRVGEQGSRTLVAVYNNITARKRHEANLAFLAEVSQDLARLTSIGETMDTLGAKLGRHFHATRCAFFEFSEALDGAVCEFDWHQADAPSLVGSYRTSDFYTDEFLQGMRAGEPFVVRDRETDPRVDGAALAPLQIASYIVIPIAREGQLRFALSVYDARPRDWRADEVDLMREITSRLWTRLERARAEEALGDSERRLRALIENLPGGAVFVVDPGLRYQVAEGEALGAAGMSAQQFVGRTVAEVVAPELAPIYEAHYRQALAGQGFELEHDQGEASFITRGVPLRGLAGEVSAALTISYDITARKRAEVALRASEERFRAVANLVPDLLWESAPDGSTTWYNGRWLAYTGQIAEQATGWGWTDAIHPEDRDVSAQRYRQAAAAGQLLRHEHRIRRQDGEYRWFAVNTVPVTDERGETVKIYGAATDVHELHTLNVVLEAQVERRTRRLADLNSELRALATASSQELVEPLRRVRSVLGLLERRVSAHLDEPARKLLAMLQGEARRAEVLSENFRSLAQLEQRELRWGAVPLAPLVTQVRSDLAPALMTRTGHWTVGELPVVDGDSLLLRQAFSDLIHHALNVVPPGREAHVEVAAVASGLPVTVDVWPLAPGAVNFETDGVVNARRIVQRHGGTMNVALHGERVRFELHLSGRRTEGRDD